MSNNFNFQSRPSFPLVSGHRGARGHCPENTLEAASLAYNRGAHFWEMDVNYTKDKAMVIVHDDTLTRTTNVETAFPGRSSYRVCDFTLEEILSLDAGSWYIEADPFGCLSSLDKSTVSSFKGLRIPTLEEALKLTKNYDWAINVEIKDHAHLIGHETITKEVISLIKKLDMLEQVLLSSFQHIYLSEAHSISPELATGALVEDIRPENPVALCKALHAKAYHPGRNIVTPKDLKDCQNAGIATYIWTVNDPNEAIELIKNGASGIFSDFPAECLKALSS